MSLRVAIVGYNRECALHTLKYIATNDQSPIANWQPIKGKAVMADGTIYQVFSDSDLNRLDGLRIDQVIVTDDYRWMVYFKQGKLLHILSKILKCYSCVPEEFRMQEYEY